MKGKIALGFIVLFIASSFIAIDSKSLIPNDQDNSDDMTTNSYNYSTTTQEVEFPYQIPAFDKSGGKIWNFSSNFDVSSALDEIDTFVDENITAYIGSDMVPFITDNLFLVRITLTQIDVYDDHELIGKGDIFCHVITNGYQYFTETKLAGSGETIYPNEVVFYTWAFSLDITLTVYEAGVNWQKIGEFSYSTNTPTTESISGITENPADAFVYLDIEVLDTQVGIRADQLIEGTKPYLYSEDDKLINQAPDEVCARVLSGYDDVLDKEILCIQYVFYWLQEDWPLVGGVTKLHDWDYEELLIFYDPDNLQDPYRIVFDNGGYFESNKRDLKIKVLEKGMTEWPTTIEFNITDALTPLLGDSGTGTIDIFDLDLEAASDPYLFYKGSIGINSMTLRIINTFHSFDCGEPKLTARLFGWNYAISSLTDSKIREWYGRFQQVLDDGLKPFAWLTGEILERNALSIDLMNPFRKPYVINNYPYVVDAVSNETALSRIKSLNYLSFNYGIEVNITLVIKAKYSITAPDVVKPGDIFDANISVEVLEDNTEMIIDYIVHTNRTVKLLNKDKFSENFFDGSLHIPIPLATIRNELEEIGKSPYEIDLNQFIEEEKYFTIHDIGVQPILLGDIFWADITIHLWEILYDKLSKNVKASKPLLVVADYFIDAIDLDINTTLSGFLNGTIISNNPAIASVDVNSFRFTDTTTNLNVTVTVSESATDGQAFGLMLTNLGFGFNLRTDWVLEVSFEEILTNVIKHFEPDFTNYSYFIGSFPNRDWIIPSGDVVGKSILIEDDTTTTPPPPPPEDMTVSLNWSYTAGNAFGYSSPLIIDLDHDGNKEVIVGCTDTYIYCFNSDGSIKWSYKTDDEILASAAAADLDGDGKLEVIIPSWDYFLYCIDFSGQLVWKHDLSYKTWATPTIADLDKDGKVEIIINSGAGLCYCLNSQGARIWVFKTGWEARSSPAVADIDNDGYLEVLIGHHTDFNLYCLDHNGNIQWSFQTGGKIQSSPAIGDLNYDGNLEIIVTSYDHKIYCLSKTGAKIWEYTISDVIYTSPVIANLDKSGDQEIIFGGSNLDETVYCLDSDGNLNWEYNVGAYVYSSPAVADLNGDGPLEVVIGSYNGMYCFKNDGTLLWTYLLGETITSGPTIADIDKDNIHEILFGAYDNKLHCLRVEDVFESGDEQWYTFSGSMQRTGQIDSDHDYLDDLSEEYYNTNPNISDGDYDGYFDGIEVLSNRDPNDLLSSPGLLEPITGLNIDERWIFTAGGAIHGSSPTVVDINGDSHKEILIGSTDNYLNCLHDNGTIYWQFEADDQFSSSPGVVDFDGDGLLEIIATSFDYKVYCLDNLGNQIWNYTTGGIIRASPTIADIDKDGEFDILIHSEDGYLYCLDEQGNLIWQFATASGSRSTAALADINKDGYLEIIIGVGGTANLICIDYQGNELWQNNDAPGIQNSPAIADLDNDGYLEILVGSGDTNMYCIDHLGNKKWNFTTTGSIIFFSSPTIVDIDNDGYQEVLFGGGADDHNFYCLNYDGTLKWKTYIGQKVYGHPAVADLDSDGKYEIIIGNDYLGDIRCLNSTGHLLWVYVTGARIINSAAIVDLDDDGILEIIVGSNSNKVYCFDLVNVEQSGPGQWYTFHGSMLRTGTFDSDSDYLDDTSETDYYGTDYLDGDTDNDQLTDLQELYYQTDPTDDDCDNDNLKDGQEILIYGTDPLDSDTDDDYLLDGAEIDYGTDPFDEDSDNDGLLDGEEILASYSDPLVVDTDGDGIDDFEEVYVGNDGFVTDPTEADTDSDGIDDNDEITLGSDPTDDDTDSDGLLDGEELILGTNPLSSDSDIDGLSDFDELNVYFTDPTTSDTDSDGLSDFEELFLGNDNFITDPNNSDSDSDGINDLEETTTGIDGFITDPNSVDTDSDGLTDLEETTIGLDGFQTDPTEDDTDGDSYSDYVEYLAGTDPTDPNSNPGVPETVTVTVTVESGITLSVIIILSSMVMATLSIIFKKRFKKQ